MTPPGFSHGMEFPFRELAAAEERHFWFRARNRAIRALAAGFLPRRGKQTRILEIGCGTGNVLRMLSACVSEGIVAGMDLRMEGLRYAASRGAARILQGDLARPPLEAGFDAVGLFDVLEHMDDDRAALASARSLLRPDGVVLLTVPAHMALWSRFDVHSGHRRRYTVPVLRDTLAEAGFEAAYATEFMAPLLPVVWLARRAAGLLRRGRAAGNNADAPDWRDLRVVPVLNGVLEALHAFEPGLIRRRARIPFGASILAAARRR